MKDDRSSKKTKLLNQIVIVGDEFLLEGKKIKIGTNLEAYYDDDKCWYLGVLIGFTKKRVKLHFSDDNSTKNYSSNLRFPHAEHE